MSHGLDNFFFIIIILNYFFQFNKPYTNRLPNPENKQDINILNNRIDKLENENSKLIRAIRKDRRRSDMAQLTLEHSIVELTDKLDELSSQGSIDNYQVDYRSDNYHTSPRRVD